jgi:predicted nucleic acid-binding protein
VLRRSYLEPAAWIAALAILRAARLVHRDPEYDAIPELVSERLPDR